MNRIKTICAYLYKSKTLADVGCDHGYCAEYALVNGLCEKVFITDISAKCLAKAEKLLARYIENGSCVPVCCDGLIGIDASCEQVLIAGMGGDEILKIIAQGFIPQKFVFQPMKNAKILREYLIKQGCKIIADDVFYDDKYYFLIKGERDGGTKSYSESELLLGRDSLKNPIIKAYAAAEADKRRRYLENALPYDAAEKLGKELRIYTEVAEK